MRYTWIDGIYVEVSACDRCPFYCTEYEMSAYCNYPQRSAEKDLAENDCYGYLGGSAGVAPDCPLRVKR